MAENKQNLPDKVAVFVSGGLYDNSLGRLEKGYQILDSEKADSWMKITSRVREASPNEVASAYGV